MQDYVIR